jgi:hypothetical protein
MSTGTAHCAPEPGLLPDLSGTTPGPGGPDENPFVVFLLSLLATTTVACAFMILYEAFK